MHTTAYLISDLHLGLGRLPDSQDWHPLEDFVSDDAFCAFVDHISNTDQPVELIIAGDFIDYPQILPELSLTSPAHRLGCTEQESLERTRVVLGLCPEIASGHPAVFTRLRQFVAAGHSLTILAGNHDIDLLWPRVWALLFDTIYTPGAAGWLKLVPFSYTVGTAAHGQIYIEHGQEHDPANAFGDRMERPFDYDTAGVQRLKRCWGTLFVDEVYNQLERDLWFVDNVKPILRLVRLGLQNDFAFTARALALLAQFLLSSGTPFGEMLGATLGPEPEWPESQRTGPALVAALSDDELQAHLAQQMTDPAFRAAFEQEVQRFSDAEWRAMARGSSQQPTLEQAVAETQPAAVLGGLFGGEDAYTRAARDVLEHNPALGAVVMGHTHTPIDGLTSPLHLSDGRSGYYFNSGTWIERLRTRPGHEYTWDELGDRDNYTSSLTYLRCVPNADGAYRVELRNWATERDG